VTGFAGAQQTVSDVIVGRRRDTGKPWRGPLLPRRISPRITIADAMAKAVMVQGGIGTATAPSQAPLVTVHTSSTTPVVHVEIRRVRDSHTLHDSIFEYAGYSGCVTLRLKKGRGRLDKINFPVALGCLLSGPGHRQHRFAPPTTHLVAMNMHTGRL